MAFAVATTGMTVTTASASEPADAPIWEERADRLCDRVPRLQHRVDRVLDRIQGDADRRGSIAWLEERAQRAAGEGHDDLATFLEHRATIRTARIDVLEARLDALVAAASWCGERDGSGPTK